MTSRAGTAARAAPVLALAALAALLAALVHTILFPHLTGNADEGVYLLQGEALARGSLTLPVDSYGGFLRPWLTGEYDGHLYTKYLPGLPALIAAAIALTGSPVPALAAVAALWVVGVYALGVELLGSRPGAITAAGLTVLSPIFLVHSAVFLSYAPAAALLTAGTAAWLRGTRLGRPPLLLAAGALFGATFLVRQYDVLLAGLVVLSYLLVRLRRHPALLLRRLLPVAAGGLPFLVLTLAYNTAVTGAPLRMPLSAADPLDTFGFGPRRMLPDQSLLDYGPGRAVDALVAQLGAVPSWTFGGPLLLVLAVAGALPRRHRPERVLLVALCAVFPVGYLFFWGTALAVEGARNGLGPHYWLGSFGPLAVLAGAGLVEGYAALAARGRRPSRLALVVLAAVAATVTAVSLAGKVGVQRYVNSVAASVREPLAAGQLQSPALVIVAPPAPSRWVGVPYPFLRNDPDLRDPVVYAASRGPADVRLAEAAQGRALYALRLNQPAGTGPVFVPQGRLVPLTTVRAGRLEIHARVAAPASGGCAVAYLRVGVAQARRPLPCPAPAGQRYPIQWVLGGPGADVPLPATGNDVDVAVGVTTGTDPDIRPADEDAAPAWEQRDALGVRGAPESPQLIALTPGAGWRSFGADGWRPARVDHLVTVEVRPVSATASAPPAP